MTYKKYFIAIALLFIVAGIVPSFASAIKAGDIPDNDDLLLPATPGDIDSVDGLLEVVAGIVRVIYTVFFIMAVLIVIFAAYKFLFSNGDPKNTETAKKMIIWAAVAIAVALLAVSIQFIVSNFLEDPGNLSGINSNLIIETFRIIV